MRGAAGCFSTPLFLSFLFLVACTVATSPAEPAPMPVEPGGERPADPAAVREIDAAPDTSIEAPELADCYGALKQGGLIICPAMPGSLVELGEMRLIASASGTVQYGLPRTTPEEIDILRGDIATTLTIAPRNDELRVVPGFDCDKVDARTPAQKAHAADSWEKKQAGFNLFYPGRGALDGFILPADARPSSPFGPTRQYIGVSKTNGQPCESMSVHQGFDLATPIGTPVYAPAAGTVTLADPNLYYEGGTIFLDHGQGLLSVFMHLSEVDVAAGDHVERGALIAKSGNTGRSTGPHLHWAVKWRNPDTDNRGGDYYIDPALLLELPVAD